MRKLAFVCMALAGLCMTQVASAVTQVWFTAVGSNANSTVNPALPGGPGQTLGLSCNVPAANTRCEWTVTVRGQTPLADASILAWANDFGSLQDAKVRIKNLQVNTATWPINPVPNGGSEGPNPGDPNDELWFNSRGQASPPGNANEYTLATFTLSKLKQNPPTVPQLWSVFTNVGTNEWGCNPADTTGGAACDANSSYPFVQFGANAPVSAEAGVEPILPVITGVNVPEPATLSLIGLGLLGLLRRRR